MTVESWKGISFPTMTSSKPKEMALRLIIRHLVFIFPFGEKGNFRNSVLNESSGREKTNGKGMFPWQQTFMEGWRLHDDPKECLRRRSVISSSFSKPRQICEPAGVNQKMSSQFFLLLSWGYNKTLNYWTTGLEGNSEFCFPSSWNIEGPVSLTASH